MPESFGPLPKGAESLLQKSEVQDAAIQLIRTTLKRAKNAKELEARGFVISVMVEGPKFDVILHENPDKPQTPGLIKAA